MLFRFTWFIILFVQVSLLICNTYFIINGDRSPLLFAVIITILCFLYSSNVLSKNMSKSSEKISDAACHCDWAIQSAGARNDLSLAVMQSQRPIYMTSLLFGRLSFAKYLSIIKKWYSFVQGLLNI